MPPILKKSDLTRERGAVSARLCARRLGCNLAMGALDETPGADPVLHGAAQMERIGLRKSSRLLAGHHARSVCNWAVPWRGI